MNDDTGSATAQRAETADTEPTPADDSGPATPRTGARRRHRGGRGRGGRGRSGVRSANGSAKTDDAGASAPNATSADQPEVDLDAQPGEVERTTTGGASRRRRRGGRGRGRGGSGPTTKTAEGGESAEATDDTGAEATTTTDANQPADGETATAPKRRRRRGGRGRRKKPAAEATDSGADEKPVDGEPAPKGRSRSSRPAKPKTAESPKAPATRTRSSRPKASTKSDEDADTQAPTRLRRQRQGRATVRRRRESMPVVPRVTDKLMVITEHGERDQIAVLEERELVQHYVTRIGARSMVGNVYLGRVQNVLPGMEAAFVDVGRGRNAVLYAGEVNWSPEDLEGAPPRIEHVLKSGQSVLVQVTKDPIGGKGARLTAQISLPGRFLVLAPNSDVSGISRRLPDAERRRLKAIFKDIKPGEHGLIVRTAAEGASKEALAADLERLLEEWKQIEKRSKKAKAPAVLYEEPELTVRVVRDLFTDEEYRELVTDSPRVFGLVTDYLRDVAPDVLSKVRLHEGPLSAFEEFHIVEQIHKGLDRRVWLPSGGYLVIDRTEAMTVIDVNTGRSVGKSNLEETVVNTNLEAASEVARQLRLRDIGGMIVIDFIDMLLEQNKRKVIDQMKEALAQDKSRSQVFDISPLGLLEVTRKRVSGGLLEAFSEPCPTCEGRGLLITYDVN
ncbi:MAG TPA: Rne/Rng family ribonuclease [Actinomycetota bacterium]|nr:Rne/Rng family ribonuclease [Actinomycetota bacterium]